jgi:hypothetical protein
MGFYATLKMSKENGPNPEGFGPFCFTPQHAEIFFGVSAQKVTKLLINQ